MRNVAEPKFFDRTTYGDSVPEALGWFLFWAFIIAHGFHIELAESLPYYRELFCGAFGILLCWVWAKKLYCLKESLNLDIDLNFLLYILGTFLLVCYVFIFPITLNFITDWGNKEAILGSSYWRNYYIRNLLLYVPLVSFFSTFRPTKIKVLITCLFFLVAALVSMHVLLSASNGIGIFSLSEGLLVSRNTLLYNSHSPYLAFGFTCGLILFYSLSFRQIWSWIVIGLCILLLYWIIIGSSRQAMLFIFLMLFFMVFYFYVIQPRGGILLYLGAASALVISGCLFVAWVFPDIIAKVYGRLETMPEGFITRARIMASNIDMMKKDDWILGGGVYNYMGTGAHNDYIRWSQRIGVPLAFLTFMPYFVNILLIWKKAKFISPPVITFCFSGIFFTLYNSVFGYPREDAFQSFICFAVLGISFGLLSPTHHEKLCCRL